MIKDLDRTKFVAEYGGVYEHSPWVAEQCFDDEGHLAADQPSDLAGPFAHQVEATDHTRQLMLLRAHPDLAGQLALGGELTAESTSEQASAGLNQCTQEELDEFTDLNTAYRQKFDFPYILAVRGRGRVEILDNFRKRLPNDMASEFREALNQVHQIAKLRLDSLNAT